MVVRITHFEAPAPGAVEPDDQDTPEAIRLEHDQPLLLLQVRRRPARWIGLGDGRQDARSGLGLADDGPVARREACPALVVVAGIRLHLQEAMLQPGCCACDAETLF